MLYKMLALHNAWTQGHVSVPEYMQAETKFHLEASGEDIAAYSQHLYDGTQFKGVIPLYLETRPDFIKLSSTHVHCANALWERRDFTDDRGIIKQHEYVLLQATITPRKAQTIMNAPQLSPRMPSPSGHGLLYILVTLLAIEMLRSAHKLYQFSAGSMFSLVFCASVIAVIILYIKKP